MARATIPIGGDFDLYATGASIRATAAYLNAATVTYTLYEADATTAVSGGTGTLTYVAASNGNYLGRVESTVTATLVRGRAYWVKFELSEGSYNAAAWKQYWADYGG